MVRPLWRNGAPRFHGGYRDASTYLTPGRLGSWHRPERLDRNWGAPPQAGLPLSPYSVWMRRPGFVRWARSRARRILATRGGVNRVRWRIRWFTAFSTRGLGW